MLVDFISLLLHHDLNHSMPSFDPCAKSTLIIPYRHHHAPSTLLFTSPHTHPRLACARWLISPRPHLFVDQAYLTSPPSTTPQYNTPLPPTPQSLLPFDTLECLRLYSYNHLHNHLLELNVHHPAQLSKLDSNIHKHTHHSPRSYSQPSPWAYNQACHPLLRTTNPMLPERAPPQPPRRPSHNTV
jgi:hypothetical protein